MSERYYHSTATNPGRVTTAQLRRKAILAEFEQWMTDKGWSWRKEVPFSELFKTKRRFRADYVIYFGSTPIRVVEINGGQWVNGRHNRGGKGYENDLTKSNLAQKAGMDYYQFTYEMLDRGEYKDIL